MSDPLHIALVAEGQTEREVIDAALRAILSPRRFVLTQLQPEATRPDMGTGWGGVLKWCQQLASRHDLSNGTTVESDPTLSLFDGVVLHLDADVATFAYSHLRPPYTDAEASERGWQALPCTHACPPAALSVDSLYAVLLSWMHPAVPGVKTVVCLPSMNTGAWQAAAKLPVDHVLLEALECKIDIEGRLQHLPKDLKIDKKKRESRLEAAKAVNKSWRDVTVLCSRAEAFDQAVRQAFL